MYDDVKIELKKTEKTLTRLKFIREKARIITLRRIKQQQEEQYLKDLEKGIIENIAKKEEPKASVKKG
jgi:hypothetical protein